MSTDPREPLRQDDVDAQREYDETPELRDTLSAAAESPTVSRDRRAPDPDGDEGAAYAALAASENEEMSSGLRRAVARRRAAGHADSADEVLPAPLTDEETDLREESDSDAELLRWGGPRSGPRPR